MENINIQDFFVGLKSKKIGKDVYEFTDGQLFKPTDAFNFVFLIHPTKYEDAQFLLSDRDYEKFKTLLKKKKQSQKGDIRLGFFDLAINQLGNKIVGIIKIKINNKICYGLLVLVPYMPHQFTDAIAIHHKFIEEHKIEREIAIKKAIEKAQNRLKEITHIDVKNRIKITQYYVRIEEYNIKIKIEFGTENNLYTKILASIVNALKIAKEKGAEVAGQGGYISIFTNTPRGNVLTEIPELDGLTLTSGNSLTASGTVASTILACKKQGIIPKESTVTIVGASGAVGKPICEILAKQFANIILTARDINKLQIFQCELNKSNIFNTRIELSLENAIKPADVVIFAVSSTKKDIGIDPSWFLGRKTVICDTSRPLIIPDKFKNLENTLILEGAIFNIPGEIIGYEFLGMGEKNHAYGCLAETITLALEKETNHQSLGIFISAKQVNTIFEKAETYGIIPIGIRFGDQKILF